MSHLKRILAIWNDENYNNRKEAEEDGAVSEIVVPENYSPSELLAFNAGVRMALEASGERLAGNERALVYTEIEYKPFTVKGRVLEWNDYTVTVWSESAQQALEQVQHAGITSYNAEDVSWGMEAAPSGVKSLKDLEWVG